MGVGSFASLLEIILRDDFESSALTPIWSARSAGVCHLTRDQVSRVCPRGCHAGRSREDVRERPELEQPCHCTCTSTICQSREFACSIIVVIDQEGYICTILNGHRLSDAGPELIRSHLTGRVIRCKHTPDHGAGEDVARECRTDSKNVVISISTLHDIIDPNSGSTRNRSVFGTSLIESRQAPQKALLEHPSIQDYANTRSPWGHWSYRLSCPAMLPRQPTARPHSQHLHSL